MTSTSESRQACQRHQQYVSDVFHELGQPLQALQFSLEMALRRELSVEGYRRSIADALEAAKRIIDTARFLRRLAEAEDPGPTSERIDLSALLRQTIEDFLPVAESLGVEIGARLPNEEMLVWGDSERLSRCLFLLVDYALQQARPATRLHMEAVSGEIWACVSLDCFAQPLLWGEADGDGAARREPTERNLQIAARMAEAVGGSLRSESLSEDCHLTLHLPVTAAPQ